MKSYFRLRSGYVMQCNLNAFSMHFDDLLMYLRLGCVLYGSNRVQQDTVVFTMDTLKHFWIRLGFL